MTATKAQLELSFGASRAEWACRFLEHALLHWNAIPTADRTAIQNAIITLRALAQKYQTLSTIQPPQPESYETGVTGG